MSYYREYFNNASTIARIRDQNGGITDFPMVKSDAIVQGWRSHAHPDAVFSNEIPDYIADPYAYFLGSETEGKYQALLAERGLPAVGLPDRGHSFSMSKYTLQGTQMSPTRVWSSYGPEYTIDFGNSIIFPSRADMGNIFDGGYPLFAVVNPTSDLETYAQRAYASAAPTSVVFDAAQFLGELREGIPRMAVSVLTNGLKFYKGLGSDYLNVQFGWKPFLNDIINWSQALDKASRELSGNGVRVHRRRGYKPVIETKTNFSQNVNSYNWAGFQGLRDGTVGYPSTSVSYGAGPSGINCFAYRSTQRTQWFEGEFTNFMPADFNNSDKYQRLAQLVNVDVTPAVLWELAPWSWLIDWQFQIGKTIDANLKASNNKLIMHYGYAMEETIITDKISVDMSAIQRSQGGNPSVYEYWRNLPRQASWTGTTTHKRRIRANPFGFRTGGLSALNLGQLAILGALGLTKAK